MKKNIDQPISEDLARLFKHGTDNEINAVATLVGSVLPFYYPDHCFQEVGSYILDVDDKPLVLVSPDGLLDHPVLDYFVCEFKCPMLQVYKTPVHYELPDRYIPQLLAEMNASRTKHLLYLCWSEKSSTVFRVENDEVLWNEMMVEAARIYGVDNPKRPTSVSEFSKGWKEHIKQWKLNKTEFIRQVPSLKSIEINNTRNPSPQSPFYLPSPDICPKSLSPDFIRDTASCLEGLIDEAYQLSRKKATEVLVFLLSDVDRSWKPEIPHALPVAYAMKGYILPTEVMRSMMNDVFTVML